MKLWNSQSRRPCPQVTGSFDTPYKPATLENGMGVMVTRFIAQGEIVPIDGTSRKYAERLRKDARGY